MAKGRARGGTVISLVLARKGSLPRTLDADELFDVRAFSLEPN